MTRPSALKRLGRPRHRPKGKYVVMPPEEPTSSDAIVDEDYTLSPASSVRDRKDVFDSESTVAPQIGVSEREKEEEYATSAAALLDKYILSRAGRRIPFAVIIVITAIIIAVIFIQDNGAGALKDWRSVLWTTEKCIFCCLVLYGIYFVYYYVTKKK